MRLSAETIMAAVERKRAAEKTKDQTKMTDFEIKGPGKYKTRDDRMAVVEEHVPDHPYSWRGHINGNRSAWYNSGEWSRHEESPEDLIAPWEEGVTFQEAVAAFDAGATVMLPSGAHLAEYDGYFIWKHTDQDFGKITAFHIRRTDWIIEYPEPDYKALATRLAKIVEKSVPFIGYQAHVPDIVEEAESAVSDAAIKALLAEDE